VGGIVGGLNNGAKVNNTYATGTITGTSSNTLAANHEEDTGINVDVGGIAGAAIAGVLSSVYATGNISGTSASKNAQVGGIAGAADDSSSIINAYATGNVSATASNTATATAGGIVGSCVSYGSATVRYAYATGAVSATINSTSGLGGAAGGIVGRFSGLAASNLVALNSSVGITGTYSTQKAHRVNGWLLYGSIANSYGKAALTPTQSQGSYTADKGADKVDGADVTVTGGPLPTAYSAPNETWWTGTAWSGANWTTVWKWDSGTGLPALR
jgi:hypothetical protein